MYLTRILPIGSTWRPLVAKFLQSCTTKNLRCTYTSRMGFSQRYSSVCVSDGKPQILNNLNSFKRLDTSSSSFSSSKSKISGISEQIPPQENAENATKNQKTTPTNSFSCFRLSPVRLAKMGPSKGRGPLIAKYAPVGFKKGFGAIGLGRHTKKGFFLINSMLVPKFHFANLKDFPLKPYVCPQTYKLATQRFWTAEEEEN